MFRKIFLGIALAVIFTVVAIAQQQPTGLAGYKKITVFPREFKLRVEKVDRVTTIDSSTGVSKTKNIPDANDPITKIVNLICDYAGITPNFVESYEFRLRDRAVSKPRNGLLRLPGGTELDLAQIPDEAWNLIKNLDRRKLIAVSRENTMLSVVKRPWEKETFKDEQAKWEFNYVDPDPPPVDTTADETEYHSSFTAFFGNLLKPPENRQISDGTWDYKYSGAFTLMCGETFPVPFDKSKKNRLEISFGNPFYKGYVPEDNSVNLNLSLFGLGGLGYSTRLKPSTAFWGDNSWVADKGPFASYQPQSMVSIKFMPASIIMVFLGGDATWIYCQVQKTIAGVEDVANVKYRENPNNPKEIFRGRIIDGTYFNYGFRLPLRTIFDGDFELRYDKYQGEDYISVAFEKQEFSENIIDLSANYRFVATDSWRKRLIANLMWNNKEIMKNVSVGLTGTYFQGEKSWYELVFQWHSPLDAMIKDQRDDNADLEK